MAARNTFYVVYWLILFIICCRGGFQHCKGYLPQNLYLDDEKLGMQVYKNDFTVFLHPLLDSGCPKWDSWFSIKLNSVSEVDTSGGTTKTFRQEDAVTSRRSLVSFITYEGVYAKEIRLSSYLPNGAIIEQTFASFPNRSLVHYGQNFTYFIDPNNIKFSIRVRNWTFDDPEHKLLLDATYSASDYPTKSPRTDYIDENLSRTVIITPSISVNFTYFNWVLLDANPKGANNTFYVAQSPSAKIALGSRYLFDSFQEELYYDPDFSVLLNVKPTCDELNHCNHKGSCVSDEECECFLGWGGADCSIADCMADCSGNGNCVLSENEKPHCYCQNGWVGNACNIPDCPGSPYDCSGRGECVILESEPVCRCRQGWTGVDCSQPICLGKCLFGGECNAFIDPPRCLCPFGYVGDNCSIYLADIKGCVGNPSICMHGECSTITEKCLCDDGWIGPDCSVSVCPGYNETAQTGNCNFLGKCMENHTCECLSGRRGDSCSEAICADDCHNQGECRSESIIPVCLCSEGWEGDTCNLDSFKSTSATSKKTPSYAVVAITVSLAAAVLIMTATISFFIIKKKMYNTRLTRRITIWNHFSLQEGTPKINN